MEETGLTYNELVNNEEMTEEQKMHLEYKRIYAGIESSCDFVSYKLIYKTKKAYENNEPIPF
jgi:hypothetical protein